VDQLIADIGVIAAGTAGLAAAVAAAEGGAKVIVFEKASTVGGAGNMAFGPFAVESRLQKEKMVALTREEAFKIHMDYTHWRVDGRLVRAFIDKSASTIDWLETMGVEFADLGCHNPGFPYTWHLPKSPFKGPEAGTGALIMKALTDRAKDLGVKLFLRTPAKKILKKGNKISGIIAEDSSGQEIEAQVKAAIIATGGFGDNPEWVKKYSGFEYGKNLYATRVPGVVGDGLRMAWEAGAAKTEIAMELTLLQVPGLEDFSSCVSAFLQPGLRVNLQGERFMDESVDNPIFIANAIARQKNGYVISILDDNIRKHYENAGFDFQKFASKKLENFDHDLIQALNAGSKDIIVAESIEELALKSGIKKDILQQTIDEYNTACETGRDTLFNKNPRFLRTVNHPRYYAGKLFPRSIGSIGGIKINYKTEVMTPDFEVIPGLYAAGLDANAIYGEGYAFVLPGSTMGFALNSGRIAGENAAKFVKWKD
jgi:fumarate reductase flavoprotein subunit